MDWRMESDAGTQVLRIQRVDDQWSCRVGRRTYSVRVLDQQPTALSCLINGHRVVEAELRWTDDVCHIIVEHIPFTFTATPHHIARRSQARTARRMTNNERRRYEVTAPMPCRIVAVHVQPGDRVIAGQPVLAVEAMKMQNEIHAPTAGTIAHLYVTAGQSVEACQPLLIVSRS